MPLLDALTLPARLAVAGVETTLALGQLVAPDGPVRRPGGYAERALVVLGENGLVDRLAAALSDPAGPRRIVDLVASALDPQRPLGQALAPGGTLDRMFAEDGPVTRILAEDGLLDRLLTEDGFVEKLVADGGTLDQLVALGETLERIQPRLGDLADLVPELHASVNALNEVVEPLSQLANRIPGGRRRTPLDA